MKRLPLFILFFFVTGMLFIPGLTLANDTERMIEQLNRDPQKRRIYEEVKNLYSAIYSDILVEPTRNAVRKTAESTGYSQSEMAALQQNSIEPLLRERRTLSITDAQERLRNINRIYNEIQEMAQFEADIQALVQPSERFSNGDTDDSGFDLLVDLHTIDLYLFGSEQSPMRPGGSGSFPSSGRSDSSSDEEDSSRTPRARTEETETPSSSSQSSPILPSSGTTALSIPLQEPILDSSQCFADPAFRQAIENFERERGVAAAPSGGSPRGSSRSSSTGARDSDASAVDNAADIIPLEPPPPPEPAESEDWSIPKPCNDIFCFDVQYITKTASPYPDTENCIVCHVQKMNDILRETTSASLLPGKVTGNLLEPSFCKNALATRLPLGMNVHIIGQPVLSPPNDDQIVKFDLSRDFRDLKKKMFGDAYEEPGRKKSLDDIATKRATNLFPNDTSISTIQEEVTQTVAVSRLEATRNLERSTSGGELADQTNYFQILDTELSSMNEYFLNMQRLFQDMYESVITIEEYQYCS